MEKKNEKGSNTLHIACENGKTEIVKLLIEKKVNLQTKNILSENSLHLAIKSCNLELVELLVNNGLNLEEKNGRGETPLLVAYDQVHMKMVEFLLEKGVNVLAKDNYGNNIMHKACHSDDIEAVHILIERGGELYDRNKAGKLPIDLWINKHTKEALQQIYDNVSLNCQSIANILAKDFLGGVKDLKSALEDKKGISKENFIKNVMNNFAKNKTEFTKQDYFIISQLINILGDDKVEINKKFNAALVVKVLEYHNIFIKPDENFKIIIASPEVNLEMLLTVFCTLPQKGEVNYELIKESINKLIETSNNNSEKEKYIRVKEKFSHIVENNLYGDFQPLNLALNELLYSLNKAAGLKEKYQINDKDFNQQKELFLLKVSNPYQTIQKINSCYPSWSEKLVKIVQDDDYLSCEIGGAIRDI